jgi:hypothetical protein
VHSTRRTTFEHVKNRPLERSASGDSPWFAASGVSVRKPKHTCGLRPSQHSKRLLHPPGYRDPYDVAFSPSTNLIRTTCDASSVRIDLGSGSPDQYIYNTDYLYKPGISSGWTPVSYTSAEALVSGSWYPKSANITIPMTSTELQNTNYILGYLCTWNGTSWKCGCRDAQCVRSYWQIQSFMR